MRTAVLAAVVVVLSCASDPYVEDMMPGPAYYEAKDARRFLLWLPGRSPAVVDVLYATDREDPAVLSAAHNAGLLIVAVNPDLLDSFVKGLFGHIQ